MKRKRSYAICMLLIVSWWNAIAGVQLNEGTCINQSANKINSKHVDGYFCIEDYEAYYKLTARHFAKISTGIKLRGREEAFWSQIKLKVMNKCFAKGYERCVNRAGIMW